MARSAFPRSVFHHKQRNLAPALDTNLMVIVQSLGLNEQLAALGIKGEGLDHLRSF